MMKIQGSVGRNGVNRGADVALVQLLLNKFILFGDLKGSLLVPDGIAGDKTKGAIGAFQRTYLGFSSPDKRVDPGGQTLAALNGPLSAPKKTAKLPPEVEGTVSLLRSSAVESLRFQMGSLMVEPRFYRRVADVIESRRVDVVYMSGMGSNALYHHTNAGKLGGTLTVGFDRPRTPTQQSIVIHESTHAVCDDWGRPMSNVQAEALAHLAQAIFYRKITGKRLNVFDSKTTDVLSTCFNIAIRMDMDKSRVVTQKEQDELNKMVTRLPSVPAGKGFYYDGL